jgi:DNA polymerase III subunit epsilon
MERDTMVTLFRSRGVALVISLVVLLGLVGLSVVVCRSFDTWPQGDRNTRSVLELRQDSPDKIESEQLGESLKPYCRSETEAEEHQRHLEHLRAVRDAHRASNVGDVQQKIVDDGPQLGISIPMADWGPFVLLVPQRFVVLDLETTGLNPYRNEIIEIGAIKVDVASLNFPTFQVLVKPEKKIPREATEINGITQEMVEKDGVVLAEALNNFREFVGDLPFVTYNADFDMKFLWCAGDRNGIRFDNRYCCALKRARRAWQGLPSYRLDYLAEVLKIKGNAHRALGDCQRALPVFIGATAAIGKKGSWDKRPTESI